MKLSLWHKKILLGYAIGVLVASIFVPWHATKYNEGSSIRDYLGYHLLWSRPDYGRWLIEIDFTIVILEIVALSAGVGITILGREFWDLWSGTKQ